MKLATYRYHDTVEVGAITEDLTGVCPLHQFGLQYANMLDVIRHLSEKEKKTVTECMKNGTAEKVYPLAEVELLAPIRYPEQDVVCLGINYAEHAKESEDFTSIRYTGEKEPAIYFSKRVNEAVAPFGAIDGHLDIVEDLDYEVELAVILGKDALHVQENEVQDYIFGYAVLNDVSARSFQRQHKQWYRGKSLDGFTPMGPWIVTADEIAYPPALHIEAKVNGALRQSSNTNCMIHDLTEIITELTDGMTLRCGTILATGTPSGVAMGMQNPDYLKKGDVVECTIEKIGSIRNVVK